MKTASRFKPENTTVESADSIGMSISQEGAVHLMSTLTNLYSNPPLAVLREISSNAVDAHINSGQTKPINISISDRRLTVQDFGTGMDRADIENVYSKYGASTKRDSNTQIGAFGLGAKSPLAIADRFSVVTIKNGVKLVLNISKNEKGAGVVHIVSETPSTEPSGTTVDIESNFSGIDVSMFFRTWDPASFNLSARFLYLPAQTSTSVYSPEYTALYEGEDLLGWIRIPEFSRGYGNRYSTLGDITIGGIQYSLEASGNNSNPYSQNRTANNDFGSKLSKHAYEYLVRTGNAGIDIVINMPIGSLELTPSREAIMVHASNAKLISDRVETIKVAAQTHVNMSINRSATHHDAIQLMLKNLALVDPGYVAESNRYYNGYTPSAPIKQKDGSYSYGIQYRGQIIPTDIPTVNHVAIFGSYNASTWQNNNKPKLMTAIPVMAILRDSEWNNILRSGLDFVIPGPSRRFNKKEKTSLVVYGKASDENYDLARRNARDYMRSLGYEPYPTLYFIDSENDPQISWLDGFDRYLSLEDMVAKARATRSARSKAAAERRAANGVKRKPADHYALDIVSSSYKKVSSDDFEMFDKIVVIDGGLHSSDGFYSYLPGDGSRVGFWDTLEGMVAKKKNLTYEPLMTELLNNFKVANSNNGSILPVVVPSGRRVSRVQKEAGDKFVSFEEWVVSQYNLLDKTDKNAFAFLVTQISSIAPNTIISNKLARLSPEHTLTNPVIERAVKAIAQKDALCALASLTVMFQLVSTRNELLKSDVQADKKKLESIRELNKIIATAKNSELNKVMGYLNSNILPQQGNKSDVVDVTYYNIVELATKDL